MSGNDSGSRRIADMMQGVPLDFGGIGTASWRTDSEPSLPAPPQLGAVPGFDVFLDENQPPPPVRRVRTKACHSTVGADCNDENRPPEGRLRGKARGLQPAAAAGFQIFTDENCPPAGSRPARAKPLTQAVAGGFSVFSGAENRVPAVDTRQRAKTFNQAAANSFQVFEQNKPPAKTFSQVAATGSGFQIYDENRPAAKTFGQASIGFQIFDENAAAEGAAACENESTSRPGRAQQRKQKLKQRPLQDLQNSKRAALQPLQTSVSRLLSATSAQPCTATSPVGSDKENASPEILYEAVLRPALDVPMASPESSLHSSLDSITLSARRSRLEALFSYEEYAVDLYAIMRDSEMEHRPRHDFMSRQPDITVTMRAILVDWLVEVNDEYKLNPETLHLAVNYIDRFLSVMTVVRAKLQLVGTTALFIASKYEEIYPPTVAEFVYITDDTYTSSQLKRMEHVMLKMLAFDMSAPTANWFLNYYIDNGGHADDTVKHLAQYLVELALVQYDLCNRHLSSLQAASALCLARLCAGHEPWTPQLERVSGLGRDQLRPCVEELHALHQMARDLPQQAVVDKFSKDKFLAVSQLEPPASISGWV